jgi:hypothetical protein
MGVVYRVFDRVTGEERALKRIRAESSKQRLFVGAFEREYHVLATLDHPRIIRVFDYAVDELGPYYTMELLSGCDMRKAAPVAYREACRHLRDVASSLALLHARRLIHRDLSPGNVRMTADGHCKLLDFGALADFGIQETVAGTPPVVPPEAFGHAALDQRSDLYSLGALAYWMLTGRHAFPARRLDELPAHWQSAPPSPSSLVAGIPTDLDALVLSLLNADPLARPASAAEVIGRFAIIGELPEEGTTETRRLALSFLASPPFVGRAAILDRIASLTGRLAGGKGGAMCIDAVAGMGRSRLLEEIGVRGQIAGAAVVRVDASADRRPHGSARSLVIRLAEAFPELARKHAGPFRRALDSLGSEVRARLAPKISAADPQGAADADRPLEEWFAAVSRDKPLVLQIDNVECADDASLGLLAGLAKAATDHPVVVVATECVRAEPNPAIGLATFRDHAVTLTLEGLDVAEVLELVRSLFGDAPNLMRFAEWLFERTAGSPLHALEISRQLLARNVIHYSGGVWSLPDHAPEAGLPAALGDALQLRCTLLSEPARILAECLSLQRQQSTLELCALLSIQGKSGGVRALLDELAERDVLYADRNGYRFSSVALQDALLAGMDDGRLTQNHQRLGEAFATLAGDDQPTLRIEAGWHLIQGGEEIRGADLIASVTKDGVTPRDLFANLHRIGQPLEAALKVYGKHHRSLYERVPLLAALAQGGYYEDRSWAERYGDEALYVVEELSGLGTARRLRRFCGAWLALVLGILTARIRFLMAPPEERQYPFGNLMVHLFGTVTTLAGVASLVFDAERTDHIAGVLEPFSILPERLTPAGIYAFCQGLADIAREKQAETFDRFEVLLKRFLDPRYYPTLPADARKFYVAGAHYVRGSLGAFRADGRGVLESADALDATGLKLYALIASQLRWLHCMLRGEFAQAVAHREQIELHAAHVGSAWQVETWEAAALLLVYPQIGDVVGSTRLAHRLELLSRTAPSIKRYVGLAKNGLLLTLRESVNRPKMVASVAEYDADTPRSYMGWAGTMGYVARGRNFGGAHAEAKAGCERALAHVTEADREYVLYFLTLDLELATADAALGRPDDAIARVDALLERYKDVDHRLALGLLHETRATVAWSAGRVAMYEESLKQVERWFLPTQEPGLVARCSRLAELSGAQRKELESPPDVNAGAARAAGDLRTPSGTRAAGDAEETGEHSPITNPTDQESADTVVSGRPRRMSLPS